MNINIDKQLGFQNGCNKVVIELRVVQFWSEIILVISNRTRIARMVREWTFKAYCFSLPLETGVNIFDTYTPIYIQINSNS